MRRRTVLGALLAALPGCARGTEGPLATPIPLAALPGNGALRPLGGLEIDRSRLRFGGISGLHLAPDLTVTVVSDLSYFAELSLSLDDALRPVGLTLKTPGRLRDGAGRILPRGYPGDAEALARLPDGGWLVSYERWHRIRRYRRLDGPGAYVEAPPGLERASMNTGLEALAVLADGRWLALAEDLPLPEAPSLTAAWLRSAGGWMPLAWRPEPGLHPVDAAALPDGGALVLERGFSLLGGFSGRLVRVPAGALAAAALGTVLEGEEVLRLAAPLPVDNFEAVSAVTYRDRLLVAIASDDNENPLQRALLLLFELQPGR